MTGLYVALGLVVFVGLMLWRAKKTGQAVERGKTAEKALETISKANAPFSDPDLQRVREKWRRD